MLNNVKVEQSYMRSFLNFLLEQNAYVTKSGDNLSKIARDNNLSLPDLLKLNPQIKDANKIGIGDSINIPGSNNTQRIPTSGIKSFARRAAKLGGEFTDLMPDLEREEGYREFAYPDPLNPKTGPITVGIGSTRTREAEGVLRDRGLDPNRVFDLNPNTRQGVSRDVANKMAGAALIKNEPRLRSMYPTYDQESASTRNVLRSMAYNMGPGGLDKFKDMKRDITAGDTVGMRAAALDSKRARQIPARAKREAEMMMPRPRKDERTGRMYSPLPPE